MLQYVCVRTIGVLLLFIDNAAICLCQNNDRCVVIVHRLCCRYVCVRTISVLLSFIDNAAVCLCQIDRCVVIIPRIYCRMFVSER